MEHVVHGIAMDRIALKIVLAVVEWYVRDETRRMSERVRGGMGWDRLHSFLLGR